MSSSNDAKRDAIPSTNVAGGGASAMSVPLIPQLGARYPMYFPGTPLFYPSMMGSQPAAMLQLRGLKAATIPASGQFTGVAMVTPGGEGLSNQAESKADNATTQGSLPSFFTAGGFPMPSVGIPVDPSLMSGLPMVPGQFLSTVPTAQPTSRPADDHTHHWKNHDSPRSRAEEDSPHVVHVSDARPTAMEHSTPIDNWSKSKRSCVPGLVHDSRVKRPKPSPGPGQINPSVQPTPHTSSEPGPTGPTPAQNSNQPSQQTGGGVSNPPQGTHPVPTTAVPPVIIHTSELQACQPYITVSDVVQNLFKPCINSPAGTCYAWNTTEKVSPLSLDACLHLTVMYLAHLKRGEHLSAEKLRALLFSAQLGETSWLSSSRKSASGTSSVGSMHSLVSHLTNMGLYSAEGGVVVKETDVNLMDGIRGAVHSVVTALESSPIPHLPKFVVVVCTKESRLSSFCIVSCNHTHNRMLTSVTHKLQTDIEGPIPTPNILSSKFEHFLSSHLDTSKVTPPFLNNAPISSGNELEGNVLLPEGVSTIKHTPPISNNLEVLGVVRCLYNSISTNILNTKGPFRAVDFAFISPDSILLSDAKTAVQRSGLVSGLASNKSSQFNHNLDACFLSLTTPSHHERFHSLLDRVVAQKRCLFIAVLLQSEQFCASLLPQHTSFFGPRQERDFLDQLQAAPNVLFIHLTQAPYSLQTSLSIIPPESEFTWAKCQSSIFGRRPSTDELDEMKEVGVSSGWDLPHIGSSQVDYRSDSYFEDIYTSKLPRKPKSSSVTTRARLLYEDYSKAIFQTVGIAGTPPPAPSNETLLMMQRLLTLPLTNRRGQGCMVVLRCPDFPLAQVFYKKLLEVRDGCGLKYRFEVILDNSAQELTLSDHFRTRVRVWKFGTARLHSEPVQKWVPATYEDLEGLPCVVLLAGKCRGGLRFPQSLRYVDCRLCYGREVTRSMFECDMHLFTKQRLCFLPRGLTEDDTFASVTDSSKPAAKMIKKEQEALIEQPVVAESHSKATDEYERSPGTPSADGRIKRDFSDIDDNASILSSGRRSNSVGNVSSIKGGKGVVEWRGSGVASQDEETPVITHLPPPAGVSVSDAKLKSSDSGKGVGSSEGATRQPNTQKPDQEGTAHQTTGVLSPRSTNPSNNQGYPAITLVTEPADDLEGMDQSSLPGPHPWSASLHASFVTQRSVAQIEGIMSSSTVSGEVPNHLYDDSTSESEDDCVSTTEEEAELAVGEEYLTIPRVCILSSTYQSVVDHQKVGVYQERLFLDPAPNCELNHTSKRQPLISEDFHISSTFYRKWIMSFCRSCTFCRWINSPRHNPGRDKGSGSKGDVRGSPLSADGKEKHFLLCGPPEVDKVGAVIRLIYAIHKEIFSMDKITVRNSPLLPQPARASRSSLAEEEFNPQVQELFKSKMFSRIVSLNQLSNLSQNGTVEDSDQWLTDTASPEAEVELSAFCSFDAKHTCSLCVGYLKGTSPDQQAVTEMLFTVKGSVSAQIQFFIPKSHLKYFEVDSASSRNANHYILQRLKLSQFTEHSRGRRILSPIFTPTTGRHDVGLINIHHALEGAEHVHVLVISQSEVTSYRHLWPNHVLMVLPDEERFKGYGAICYWIKKFLTVNYDNQCKPYQEKYGHRPWPYAVIMSDSCLMWKKQDSIQINNNAGDGFSEDVYATDVSLFEVLTSIETNPEVQHYSVVGLLPWAERLPVNLQPFSRVQVDHGVVLLNVALTSKINYNRYLYNSADLDFNLHLESHNLPVVRCNKFAMLKKPHTVGGKLSASQSISNTKDFVVSLHQDAPNLLYYPGPLLMEEHLTHQGKQLFELGCNRENPILILDTFVNIGPGIHSVFVSTTDQQHRQVLPANLDTILFGGALLYLCESFIFSARHFLQRVKFAQGASLCLVTRDCRSMVKDVARLDLDEKWKYQARNEHQTACPDSFRPLFYLIRKYEP